MFNTRLRKNIDFLKEFVEVNDLNRNDIIHFSCNFDIKSELYSTRIDCEAIISFTNLKSENDVFVDCDLDSDLYPTSFSIKFQEMDVDCGVLLIYGKHPKIGLYRAVITPYEII